MSDGFRPLPYERMGTQWVPFPIVTINAVAVPVNPVTQLEPVWSCDGDGGTEPFAAHLVFASSHGDLEEVRRLMYDYGVSANARSRVLRMQGCEGSESYTRLPPMCTRTCLHCSGSALLRVCAAHAMSGQERVHSTLLARFGWTPLFAAVTAGHPKVVRELIQRGASLQAYFPGELTPLLSCVIQLCERAACVGPAANEAHARKKAIAIAAVPKYEEILQILLKHGASLTERFEGLTALEFAQGRYSSATFPAIRGFVACPAAVAAIARASDVGSSSPPAAAEAAEAAEVAEAAEATEAAEVAATPQRRRSKRKAPARA